MANRDFDPFASSYGTGASTPAFLPPLAQAKLDEFFVQVQFFLNSKFSVFAQSNALNCVVLIATTFNTCFCSGYRRPMFKNGLLVSLVVPFP
jgi:hypothetical protein